MIPAFRADGPRTAPVLVLASSLGTTGRMWDAMLPVLTSRLRVLRIEHRGHGGSPAPAGPYAMEDLAGDVVELLDEIGVERASFAGVSLGGMVGLWLAIHRAERVERLVLACTAAELGPATPWRERAAMVRAAAPSVLAETLIGRWFTPGFVAAHPGVATTVAAMLDDTDREGYAGCCEAIATFDLRDRLGEVRAPTPVIAGADDPVTPPARALDLATGIPGAGLVVVPGAAHLAPIEQPQHCAEALLAHVTGTATARGEAVRRAVLGDGHVEHAEATATDVTAPFYDFVTRTAWGEIWSRPQLDRRTRSCITLAVLAGTGRLDELALHVTGARRNGLSREEIAEVLLHIAVYAGAPAANAALRVADSVLGAEAAEAAEDS